MKTIDFRSDSVTKPTLEMRQAMFDAEVGYDVFRDDPTVNRLEEIAADMTGKEAGLFTPTGTMANQLAILSHTNRGEEVILSADSHIIWYEVGAHAVLSSVALWPIPVPDGILRASDIDRAFRPNDIHMPSTGLVCMENALGRGTVVPIHLMEEVYQAAHSHGLPVHTDGARVFNAAHVLGVGVKEIANQTDSLAIHLSKGLCAPIGSIVVGSESFIERARRYRHMLGGGMSQTGVLAAAGIIALTRMVDRLVEDHQNARYLASLLPQIGRVKVDTSRADINMVFFSLDYPTEIIQNFPVNMLEYGIKISPSSEGFFRFVTHHDITRADIDYTIGIFEKLIHANLI